MTDVTELLPCPFCGSQPERVPAMRDFATLDDALLAEPDVRCRSIKCPIRFMPTPFALDEWNTRAARTPADELENMKLGTGAAIKALVEATTPADGERIEQIVTAWAYAHNICGAARNDLFKRLAATVSDTSKPKENPHE